MNTQLDPEMVASCADDDLDFNLFDRVDTVPGFGGRLPNIGNMGVATLAPNGTFISRRCLDDAELAQLWSEHFAHHNLSSCPKGQHHG